MKTIVLATLALVAAASIAEAQMPPGKWWQREQIARELQLTNEQKDRLEEAFRTAADGLIDAKADVEKLQVALRGELDREQLRRTEIQKVATQISSARARLFERELMMLVDMRAVLSDTQWNKLRSHLDQMRDERRPARGDAMGGGPRQPPRRGPGGRRP